MEKNTVQTVRTQTTIQHGKCALNVGLPKATNKQSEYVIIIAFRSKNVNENATEYYVYSTLPVLFSATLDRTPQCLNNITTAITVP